MYLDRSFVLTDFYDSKLRDKTCSIIAGGEDKQANNKFESQDPSPKSKPGRNKSQLSPDPQTL